MEEIYGIFSGCYSDWDVHGFLEDKEEAMKYCAIQNERRSEYDSYYVVKIDKLNVKMADVKLKYYHEVVFDFGKGMRKEPDRFEYYIGEDRQPKITYSSMWICFNFNCETREKAEKIAQDKYAQLLHYYSENNSYTESAKLLGGNSYKS